jgi:predicted TIM-barrel fold metal-dependent hydrolase
MGSEKILFGTDTYSFAFQFGRIALSDIPLKDKENILWKNAIRLFPKCFS